MVSVRVFMGKRYHFFYFSRSLFFIHFQVQPCGIQVLVDVVMQFFSDLPSFFLLAENGGLGQLFLTILFYQLLRKFFSFGKIHRGNNNINHLVLFIEPGACTYQQLNSFRLRSFKHPHYYVVDRLSCANSNMTRKIFSREIPAILINHIPLWIIAM
jgi:hypothetical protein